MEQPVAKIKVDEKILAKIKAIDCSTESVHLGDTILLDELGSEGEWSLKWEGNFFFRSFAYEQALTKFIRAEYPEAFI